MYFVLICYLDNLPLWGLVGEIVEVDGGENLYMYTHLHFDISKNGKQIITANLTSEGAVLVQEGAEVTFTYSVTWSDTQMSHTHRFEKYLDTSFYEHQVWINFFLVLINLISDY